MDWNWNQMCGPSGFVIWSAKTKDLGYCFQELCLKFPVLCLLAGVSAYYAGRNTHTNVYGFRRSRVVVFRSLVTISLALIAFMKLCVTITVTPDFVNALDYLIGSCEIITWIVHTMYIISLNSKRGLQLPLILWTFSYVISLIELRSVFLLFRNSQYHLVLYTFGIATAVFQQLYAVSLLPSESVRTANGPYERIDRHAQDGESQALLGSPRISSYGRFQEEADPLYLGIAMEDTPFLSRLLFQWVGPMMQKGADGKLQNPDDLFDLPMNLTPAYLCAHLDLEVDPDGIDSRKPARSVSLLRALHSSFSWQFYSVGILKFIADCANFVGPMLLNRLVTFLEVKSEVLEHGYIYATGLFATTLIAALCNSHFNFLMAKVGLQIRAALVTTIYRKTLTLSSSAVSSFSTGEIVNFMSTDTERIMNACPSFHAFWSIPLQIAVTFYLLYQQVGLAFLAGVAFSVLQIPINKFLASKIGQLSTRLMDCKDKRVQGMAEVLRGIKVLKMHVWEDFFIKKIKTQRTAEMKYLSGRKYLDALCVYFWATTPVIISILTFATYVLLGNKLTAATVFTTIALLNMLIAPLNSFPWVLNGLTEAWVSVKRIQRLLELPDFNMSRYYTQMPDNDSRLDIFIKDGLFTWNINTDPVLRGIDFTVMKGQLVGVTGRVGSGKSSFLASLTGDLEKLNGIVSLSNLDTGFALVTQQVWLQRGTLRDNILFGKSFEPNRYQSIIEACCLDEDLKSFPGGDLIGIGEGGAALSGGQKMRVALARAIYQDKQIYLLDDVLSAVDVKVARKIFSKCICGILRHTTRILCTHHIQYLINADHVLLLENGNIVKQGKPSDVLDNYDDLLSLAEEDTTQSEGQTDASMEDPVKDMMSEESRHVGSIRWNVYKSYWKAVGHLLSVAVLLAMLLMQASRNCSDLWLSFWVSHVNSTFSTEYYLTVYGSLAGANTIFTLFRAFLFAYGGIHAARIIHENLLSTIIKARVSFFDISPLGRILNRFSSDTYTIDDSLPFILNILLAQFFSLVGTVIVTIYGLPWLLLVMVPLVPIYHWLQGLYRLTSRELKRLSSVTLSPLYSHFNETLQGLSTIRSFRVIPRFKRENEEYLEANQKCQFASQAAAQWLGLRLQMIGVIMVTGVGFISVLQHQFDIADAGLVGLAIAYALSVTSMLSGVVNAFTETEKEMIAVERACQYIDHIEPECETEILAPPYAWPSQGVVTFRNVVLRYREYLSPVLKRVSFETRPAEKIGIMGRTGAGKSSLVTALYRLAEISNGEILIDNVNIFHISLKSLRSRLAVIPQDPFLFAGTVRENLDPGGQSRDAELLGALDRCSLSNVITKLGGLDAPLEVGGRNLSVGEKQLLCLARAVIHNAKVVCIDEATANVDLETDNNIQQTIRTAFRQSTVISIAHRAKTVIDLDRILVMGDGEVLEFETPDSLLRNKKSHFYKLVGSEFDVS